jgi:hypothetical protein
MTNETRAQIEYQTQFRRIVVRTVLLIACAALFLAVGRVLRDWQPDRRAIPLLTGDVLYYRGATFGTNHVAPGLPGLLRRLPSTLRDPIVRYLRLAPGSGQHWTSEPRLVVWLDDTHPLVTNRTAPVTIDWKLGDQSGATAGETVSSSLSSTQPGLIRLEFDAFPRRARILHVQAFTRLMAGSMRPAGGLMVSNPYRSTVVEWESGSLPLTQTNAGLECTLLALPTGVGSRVEWKWEEDASVTVSCEPEDLGGELQSAGLFSFRDPGGPAPDWTVANVRLSDATGNQLRSTSTSTSPGHGVVLFSFKPSLWPDETWRFEVLAKRTATAAFTAEEQFYFEGVPVPPEGDTERIDRVIRRGDLEVRLEQLEHHPPLGGRSGYRNADLSQLTVTVRNLAEGDYIDLIELIDDQGRPLPGAGWSMHGGNPAEIRYWIREIPSGARTIDARLAVHTGRPFVFQVRPERASTNGWSMRLPAEPDNGHREIAQ